MLTYVNTRGVSRTHAESGLGLSLTKVNDSLLFFVAESSILYFVVDLDVPLDVNCAYMYFLIDVNSLFIKFVNMT